ncbi:hypothetical protein MUG91_G534n5, partial [Manis pentadactyla]
VSRIAGHGQEGMAGSRCPREAGKDLEMVDRALGILWVSPHQAGKRAPLRARLEVSCLCKSAIQSQATDKALGSTSEISTAGSDARDEPMNTTPPLLAIIFRSPPAPHEPVGSTTAGLLCSSDNKRAVGRRLVSPGPI